MVSKQLTNIVERAAKPNRRMCRQFVLAFVFACLASLAVVGAAYAEAFSDPSDLPAPGTSRSSAASATASDASESKAQYVLLLGSDMREDDAGEWQKSAQTEATDATRQAAELNGQVDPSHADAIILVRLDPEHGKVTMLSVSRDTPYTYPDGAIDKLNSTYYREGAKRTVQAVEELTGVKIAHYAEVKGKKFEELIDKLGGISVDVPMAFDFTTLTGESVHLDAGVQTLSGAEALALANMRTLYDGNQDEHRQIAGRLIVKGIIENIVSRPLLQIPSAISDVASCVETDLKLADFIELAGYMGNDIDILSGSGPTAGDLDPYVTESLYAGGHPWLCYVNEAGWKRVMDVVDAGGDPSTVSYDDDVVHYAGQPKSTWSRGLVEP